MKKFISGLMTGVIITATTLVVMASTGLISAKIDDSVKLIVNGQQVQTQIINAVKEGDTEAKNYVSARDLAGALGAGVTWDDKTRNIVVNDKSGDTTLQSTDVQKVGWVLVSEIPKQYTDVQGTVDGAGNICIYKGKSVIFEGTIENSNGLLVRENYYVYINKAKFLELYNAK